MSDRKPPPGNQSNVKCANSIFTVISGSFRKHLKQIAFLKKELESQYISVLSPAGSIAVNPSEEFILLNSDPIDHPKILQDSVFAKIRRSTFLTVANIGGYLGKAAILEIGYAIAIGIDIYTLEPVDDPNLSPYCKLLKEVFPHLNYSLFFDNQELKIYPLIKTKTRKMHASLKKTLNAS